MANFAGTCTSDNKGLLLLLLQLLLVKQAYTDFLVLQIILINPVFIIIIIQKMNKFRILNETGIFSLQQQ